MEDSEKALLSIADILPAELDELPHPYLWLEHAAWGETWDGAVQRWRGEIEKSFNEQNPEWFVWHEKPEVWPSVNPNAHRKEDTLGPITGWYIRSHMVIPAV